MSTIATNNINYYIKLIKTTNISPLLYTNKHTASINNDTQFKFIGKGTQGCIYLAKCNNFNMKFL